MGTTELILMLSALLIVTFAVLIFPKKRKKPFCKNDGTNLRHSGVADRWYCPKCGNTYRIKT